MLIIIIVIIIFGVQSKYQRPYTVVSENHCKKSNAHAFSGMHIFIQ